MVQTNDNAYKLITQNLSNISDKKPISSDEELLHKSDTSSLSQHNLQYTLLLTTYVNNFKIISTYKIKNRQEIFNIAKKLLLGVPFTTLALIAIIIFFITENKLSILEALSGIIAALVALIGTFMVIPKIITKYLFNKNEEDHLATIIGKIQEYDKNIRERL